MKVASRQVGGLVVSLDGGQSFAGEHERSRRRHGPAAPVAAGRLGLELVGLVGLGIGVGVGVRR